MDRILRQESRAGVDREGAPAPADYDTNPDRFRATVRAVERFGTMGDVHIDVAARLAREQLAPVLDVGCGEGRLVESLRAMGMTVVGLDASPTMLRAVSAPCVQADAVRIPFGDASFGGVAALYMLYHLRDPAEVIADSRRVLREGGLFVACAPSRSDSPELASFVPRRATTFDAENGPDLVRSVFGRIEVERWDGPYITLPDREAVVTYLTAGGTSTGEAEAAAASLNVPLSVTKRGALIYARKSS